MGAFLVMIRNVILFVALAVPGYLLVRSGLLKQEQSGGFSKLLMYVGLPFLILSGTVNNLSLDRALLMRLLLVALIGIAYMAVLFFVSAPLTAMEDDRKRRGMMRFCAVFSNNGFLGIPLAIAVFGKSSFIFTALIVLNIISNLLMYTLGAYLVSGDRRSINLRKALLNPVLIAFLAGIVLNLLHVKDYVPELVSFSDQFSGIVTPISMTILGMKLASVRLSTLLTSPRGYYVSALRLVAFPVCIVALLLVCRGLSGGMIDNDVILGFFLGFAMPTAGLASTFADTYDGDSECAVVFTLGTTLHSIATIPLLYWALTALL